MSSRPDIPVWRPMGATPRPTHQPIETAPIVIVGAGPVGLALALDLGRRGRQVIVLGRLDFIAAGSKAICFSKRSLDIFDRLGVGETLVSRGVTWSVGKVFWGDEVEPIYQFDLAPLKDQKRPGFINIPQYLVEEELVRALGALPNVSLRWGQEVVTVLPRPDRTRLRVQAIDGAYEIEAQWLIACDGARSTIREALGLDFQGRVFEDNFLIADIRMPEAWPAERWFWFDPPFNRGQSALMHKQPGGVWRLDFQLGHGIDRAAAVRPQAVEALVRAMIGADTPFTPEWYSVYTFQCRRMDRFVHGHTVFAGDSAHLVSPFGARGCNGGLADIDNLGWKLDLILAGAAHEALLESYNDEAVVAADENILNSSRSTDFMTPKTPAAVGLRDAVLELARDHPFARPLVNSGRLSTAISYPDSPLNTPDGEPWSSGAAPGSPAPDAQAGETWLLDRLGPGFSLLVDGPVDAPPGVEVVDLTAFAGSQVLRERYGLEDGGAYLIRPDQYVAARWKAPTREAIAAALGRAMGSDA